MTISAKRANEKVKGGRGKIFITANSVNASNDVAKMDVICRILDPKKKEKKRFLCFCKSPEDRPFLVIERASPIKLTDKVEWCRVY